MADRDPESSVLVARYGLPVLLLAYALLLLGPASGFALGYDEAWRIVAARADASTGDFLARWFTNGLPEPISIPHLGVLRALDGLLEPPRLVAAMRLLNLASGLLCLLLTWRIGERLTGSLRVAAGASLLLAAHAWFGANVEIIKEHAWLAAGLLAWLDRFLRLERDGRALGAFDAVAVASLVLLSPVAIFPLGLALLVIGALWACGRPMRRDLPSLVAGWGFAVVWTLAGMKATREIDAGILAFFRSGGTVMPDVDHGFIFGRESGGIAGVVEGIAALFARPVLPAPLFAVLAVALLAAGVYAAVHAMRGERPAAFALSLLVLPLLTILVLYAVMDVAAARLFLWYVPLACLALAAILLHPRRVFPCLGTTIFVILLVSLLPGWLDLPSRHPLNKRFDLVAFRRGAESFDRARDVFLHTNYFAYFPQEALDPALPKAVLTDTREWHTLFLHPAFPMRRHVVPADREWDDGALAGFRGGAVWNVECYETSPVLLERMRTRLFEGRGRVESFDDWPYFWTRIAPPDTGIST